MSNENYFPWDEVPNDDVLEEGVYQLKVIVIEDGQSQSGKRMFKAQLAVVAPLEFAGQRHFENFVVGNDESPMSILPGTMGTKTFKKLMVAAQIAQNNDIQQLCMGAVGAEFLASITVTEEKDGPFKGTRRNRITRWNKLGEREVGLVAKTGAPGQRPVVKPSAAPRPPAAIQSNAPAIPPGVAAAAQSVPSNPPTAAQSVPPLGGQSITCTICGQAVPVAEFGAHMQTHVGAGK